MNKNISDIATAVLYVLLLVGTLKRVVPLGHSITAQAVMLLGLRVEYWMDKGRLL